MERADREAQLVGDRDHLFLDWQCPSDVDVLGERLAFQQLNRQEHAALVFADIVDAADVDVGNLPSERDLAPDSRDRGGVAVSSARSTLSATVVPMIRSSAA